MRCFWGLLILAAAAYPAAGSVFGKAEIGVVSDSNVYDDQSSVSDTGILAQAEVNWYGKFTENTYPRLYYSFWSVDFPDYSFENKYVHNLRGVLKHRLGDMFTLKGEAGGMIENWPDADYYRMRRYHAGPGIVWYPGYLSEIEFNVFKEWEKFPEYDLDNDSWQYHLIYRGGFGFDTDVGLRLMHIERSYSERLLFDSETTDYGELSTEFRKENEMMCSIWGEHYFSGRSRIRGGYQYAILDSTDNEIYWGPYQGEFSNTVSGDEKIMLDYWDYTSRRTYILLESGDPRTIGFEWYAHYEDKVFDGWLARDLNDELKYPFKKRQDYNQCFYIQVKRYIFGDLSLIGRFTYTKNNSNDFPYDCISRDFYGGISYYFSI